MYAIQGNMEATYGSEIHFVTEWDSDFMTPSADMHNSFNVIGYVFLEAVDVHWWHCYIKGSIELMYGFPFLFIVSLESSPRVN